MGNNTAREQPWRMGGAKAGDLPAPVTRGEKQDRVQKAEVLGGKLTLTGTQASMDRLNRVFATCSTEFQSYALTTLVNVLKTEWADGDDCAFHLEIIAAQLEGIGPQNEAEAMLATQMICANHLANEMARRTLKANMLPHLQAYGNLATKYQRTYLAQLEGLAKLRRGGKQVVEHVHVGAGGQALIANTVTTGGRRK